MRARALAVAFVAWVLAGCGSTASTTAGASNATTQASEPRTAPAAVPKARPKPKPRPSPGRLPQTHQLPSASTGAFRAEMAALWSGVRRDSVHVALSAFFPEAAYVQVKAIGDPAGDWRERLVHDFGLDLSAAHALLGTQPS